MKCAQVVSLGAKEVELAGQFVGQQRKVQRLTVGQTAGQEIASWLRPGSLVIAPGRLTGVYFQGNALDLGSCVFENHTYPTAYYLQGTSGWDATYGGCPIALWPVQGFVYTINNGTIAITNYVGSGGAVTIPSTIDELAST